MPSIGSSAKSLDSSLATAKHSSSSAASSGVTGMANAVCRKLLVMFRLLGGDDGIFARPDESLSVTDRVLGVRGRLLVERKVRWEERRVGKECVRSCRVRGTPSHKKKKKN